MNKAVFLDRDGVINHEVGNYITRFEDFHLLPFAVGHIRNLCDAGYKVVVITNQGGIAKGLYTHAELDRMHKALHDAVQQAGAQIDAIYYCPHHPEFGNCLCRKPGSLMVEKAIARFQIDPTRSVFIGDKPRDMEAAEGAGVRGILIHENSDWGPIVEELLKIG